jgi:hypothetical protein
MKSAVGGVLKFVVGFLMVGLAGCGPSKDRFEDLEKRTEKFQRDTNQDLQTMKELHNTNRGARVQLQYLKSNKYYEGYVVGMTAPNKTSTGELITVYLNGTISEYEIRPKEIPAKKTMFIYYADYNQEKGNLLASLLGNGTMGLSCEPGEDVTDTSATCRFENITFGFYLGRPPFPNGGQ